jgi:cytochrome bd ubiquinol oxidase subunit I
MGSALDVHRLHFAFTIAFHYLFPQLTMGLALLIVILKTIFLRTGDEHYNRAARFWAKIFGINFALGVVSGIPMEFQFGTNWAEFSKSAGSVIGQTLAMEGIQRLTSAAPKTQPSDNHPSAALDARHCKP